jgi:hypothetical protein
MPQQQVLSTVLRSAAPLHLITYPRSLWLRNQNITTAEFQLLAKAADYGASTTSTSTPDTTSPTPEEQRLQRSRRAHEIVELDRLEWARERGYSVRLVALPRIVNNNNTNYYHPRRELLLMGAVKNSPAAQRIRALAGDNESV